MRRYGYSGYGQDASPSAQGAAEDLARAQYLMTEGGTGAEELLGRAAAWGTPPDLINHILTQAHQRRMFQEQQQAEQARNMIAMAVARMNAQAEMERRLQEDRHKWATLANERQKQAETERYHDLEANRWRNYLDYQNRSLAQTGGYHAGQLNLERQKLEAQLADRDQARAEKSIDALMKDATQRNNPRAIQDLFGRIDPKYHPWWYRQASEQVGGNPEQLGQLVGAYTRHAQIDPEKPFNWEKGVARVKELSAPRAVPTLPYDWMVNPFRGVGTGAWLPTTYPDTRAGA